MAEETKPAPGNQIVALDKIISESKSVSDLLSKPEIQLRALKGYAAMTNRQDGDTRFNQERGAYLELVAQSADLRLAPNFSHFKAFNKVMHSGLSLRDGKLYVRAIKKGGEVVDIKVDSSPAGKREMFEMMPTIKEVPEGGVVVKGDIFKEDQLTHRIVIHERTEKSLPPDKLENILYSYQRLIYKDGSIKDVVVPQYALFKARAKSTVSDPENAGVWMFPDEASKKTAMNRAFRLYHKYPDKSIVLDDEDDDDTKDAPHEEVPAGYIEPQPTPPEVQRDDVDMTTGEEIKPEVQEVKVVQQEQPKKNKKNLLDD